MADPLERPLPYALLPRLATADDMRRMDRHAIDELNLPARLLMENAAHAVADRVCALSAAHPGDAPVVVLCGPGNNGADGLAAARLIKNRGIPATVIQAGKVTSLDGIANFQAWRQFGEVYDAVRESAAAEILLEQAGVVVDALFGAGLARPVEGLYRDWIDRFNACAAPYKVAVDIPSGVDTDTGRVLGIAAQCTHTVTFQLGKIGLAQWPGAGLAGQVEIADISIPVHWEPNLPATYLLNAAFARAILPRRPADGHKGTFGHLLSVCGSAGMGGAALLAGLAALKCGTGLVTCGVPMSLRDRFLATAPELMTLAAEQGPGAHFAPEHLPPLLTAARARSAAVLGCGLGRDEAAAAFARRFALELERPLLIDADGLYPFSGTDFRARPAPTVITPHPGELARLSGVAVEEIGRDRVGTARRFATDWNVVLVLKGAGTVIADPSGEVFVHAVADHAFASGGTGDVLSGIIGGLMAQGLPPLRAALLGVWLHGAARTAQTELAGAFFTASDLIAGLNGALRGLGAD